MATKIDESTVQGRLRLYLKSERITQWEFQKTINVCNSYVSSISKGIGGDILRRIQEHYPELNTDWLITGEGNMRKSSDYDAGRAISLRIGKVVEWAGISTDEFCKRIEINPDVWNAAVQKYESDSLYLVRRNISRTFREVDDDWVKSGSGMMLRLEEDGPKEEIVSIEELINTTFSAIAQMKDSPEFDSFLKISKNNLISAIRATVKNS